MTSHADTELKWLCRGGRCLPGPTASPPPPRAKGLHSSTFPAHLQHFSWDGMDGFGDSVTKTAQVEVRSGRVEAPAARCISCCATAASAAARCATAAARSCFSCALCMMRRPASTAADASAAALSAAAAMSQGLILVQLTAQFMHFLWDTVGRGFSDKNVSG